MLPGASSSVDAEIARVQNEIKALDRSISAQQQKRSALSASLDALLAAKEKSDMSGFSPSLIPSFCSPAFQSKPRVYFAFLKTLSHPHPHFFPHRDSTSVRIGSERQWDDAHGFPWSSTLHSMLRECFRLHSFRPGQLEAINCVRHPTCARTSASPAIPFPFLRHAIFPKFIFAQSDTGALWKRRFSGHGCGRWQKPRVRSSSSICPP